MDGTLRRSQFSHTPIPSRGAEQSRPNSENLGNLDQSKANFESLRKKCAETSDTYEKTIKMLEDSVESLETDLTQERIAHKQELEDNKSRAADTIDKLVTQIQVLKQYKYDLERVVATLIRGTNRDYIIACKMFESLHLTNSQIYAFFNGMSDITGKTIDWRPLGADFSDDVNTLLPCFLKKRMSPRILKFKRDDFSALAPPTGVPSGSAAAMSDAEKRKFNISELKEKARSAAEEVKNSSYSTTSIRASVSSGAKKLEGFPTCIDEFLTYFVENDDNYKCDTFIDAASMIVDADFEGAPYAYFNEHPDRLEHFDDLNRNIKRTISESNRRSNLHKDLLSKEIDTLLNDTSYPATGVSLVTEKFIELEAAFLDSGNNEFSPPPNCRSGKFMISTIKGPITSLVYGTASIHTKLMGTSFFEDIALFTQQGDVYTHEQVLDRRHKLVEIIAVYTSALQECTTIKADSAKATAALSTETDSFNTEKALRTTAVDNLKTAENDRAKNVDAGAEKTIADAQAAEIETAEQLVLDTPKISQLVIDEDKRQSDLLTEKELHLKNVTVYYRVHWLIYAWMVFHQSIIKQLGQKTKIKNIFYYTVK